MDDQKAQHRRRSWTSPDGCGAVLAGYDDVIVEILARLPAKSLMRFRCVCTTWRSLISATHFVNKHLKYDNERAQNDAGIRVMFSVDPPRCMSVSDLKDSENPELDSLPIRKLESPVWDQYEKTVVGSCNGLICFRIRGEFVLWNPCTGEHNVLPKPNVVRLSALYFGFGYDEVNDDYTVVQGRYSEMVSVFSLRRGTWNTYPGPKNVYMREMGACVNGVLHWLQLASNSGGTCRYVISKVVKSFSLAEEKFLEEAMPIPYGFGEIFVSRNCLCVCNNMDVRIMMMKEYGVPESWTEVMHITDRIGCGSHGEFVQPMWVLDNGDVLGRTCARGCRWYVSLGKSKDKRFRHVITLKWDCSSEKVTYRETLVSPVTGSLKTSEIISVCWRCSAFFLRTLV